MTSDNRELTNKELASLLETSPANLSKPLRQLGMAVLVDEAYRIQAQEAWGKNRIPETVTIDNLRHAYINLTTGDDLL